MWTVKEFFFVTLKSKSFEPKEDVCSEGVLLRDCLIFLNFEQFVPRISFTMLEQDPREGVSVVVELGFNPNLEPISLDEMGSNIWHWGPVTGPK